MKRAFSIMVGLALGASAVAQADEPATAIQIVMDDSGVLQSPEQAQQYKLALLSNLKTLIHRRRAAHARIEVISTSFARTVWTGEPLDLKRRPDLVNELIEKISADPSRCNNLPGAFAELKGNIAAANRAGYSSVRVFVISSLIHTSLPCSATTRITLPQLPPAEGDFNGALTSSPTIRAITFLWVSPHQKRVWEERLTPTITWAQKAGIRFEMLDEVRTRDELRTGLNALEDMR